MEDILYGNSHYEPLDAGEEWVGSKVKIDLAGLIFVSVYSDVGSATDGLIIEQSHNGEDGTWYFNDTYTVSAGRGKPFAINPHMGYLRVRYINGDQDQGVFVLQSTWKDIAVPSSHRISDSIYGDDDAPLGLSVLVAPTYNQSVHKAVSLQNPLPTDGDSIYEKDINIDNSDSGGWDGGTVIDLFNNLFTTLSYTGTDNPKEIKIMFSRGVEASGIALGANTGDFSNVKIIGIGSGGSETTLADYSSDNTNRSSQYYGFAIDLGGGDRVPVAGFVGVKIQFHTTDDVYLSNVKLNKLTNTASVVQGSTPDGSLVYFQATQNGNFKVSMEEVDGHLKDDITGVLNVVDYAHHEIHEGDHYMVAINKDVPNADTFGIAFTTPDSEEWLHMTLKIDVELEADIKLYEGVTSFSSGSGVDIYNNNRNSLNTSGVTDMVSDPSVTLGTPETLAHAVLGSTRSVGGQARGDSEYILKQNTKYYLLITNQATGAPNETNVQLSWYEHTNI